MAQPPQVRAWPYGEALLVSVLAELGSGNVVEATIHDAAAITSGLCDGKMVYIDPAPDAINSVFHELIHRLHPPWGERRVRDMTLAIQRRLSQAQADAIMREYQRRKRVRKKPVKVEDAS